MGWALPTNPIEKNRLSEPYFIKLSHLGELGLPAKYHIHMRRVPPRFTPLAKSTVMDWGEGCLRCARCVKEVKARLQALGPSPLKAKV